MIYLTFYHGRNIFRGNEFAAWLLNFESARFEGFEYGHYLPQVSVSLQEFEAKKTTIPTKNLVKVSGKFSFLEKLIFGVRDFENEISEKTDKALSDFSL